MEDLHIPMPAFVTLQPRFPFGGLTFSRCVDALIRQDLLDPLPYVRRHICGDWGDVRAEHRRYNNAALELGGFAAWLHTYCLAWPARRCRVWVGLGGDWCTHW